ncbi:hypothetical protein, partial [Streptomyces pseudogriseolus]|uniref:hypothetical protein n=1 Tax=Streptomyces pseudogriseolus TaxID=36817 RepID=UPI003FA22171
DTAPPAAPSAPPPAFREPQASPPPPPVSATPSRPGQDAPADPPPAPNPPPPRPETGPPAHPDPPPPSGPTAAPAYGAWTPAPDSLTPPGDEPEDRTAAAPASKLGPLPPPPPSRAYVGTRPPTYDAEPTALPAADPDDLDALVPDTVLDGARYGACTLRAVSVRGDSARYRGEPRRDDLPYFTDDAKGGPRRGPGGPGSRPGAGVPGPGRSGGPTVPPVPTAPSGPTGGPVTGDGPMTPPSGGTPFTEERTGSHAVPGGGLSDDTAILTPQKPAVPGDAGYPRHDNVSGHTVTSGIPVVPPSASFDAPGMGPNAPGPHTPPKLPEPVSPPPAGSGKAPKKKGRSKLVLLATGVVLVAGVAYGAGLLMNRSDVPKGTTVLGVEIGGGTRDEAVKKLDGALDGRLDKPLKLSVDGKTVELQPDNAGLQVDIDATVGKAATSDYNPVNVIGSLFGQSRVVEPEIPVDHEKLQAALEDAAGGAGTVKEGSITFESGKAVPVYPQAGKGVDVSKAADVVAAAYRTQVETGTAAAVNVPTTTQQPKVTKAEVDRMMKEFAEPAMSDPVTVQTDPAHSVLMSPEKSLWKFLRVEAVNGKLVEKPDLKALENLYGKAFDGVLITRGNGEKTPVTPQDVYGALRQALVSRGDRAAVIETNAS